MMMMILQEQDLAENKICGLTQKVCTHIDIFYISWNIFTQFFFGGEEEKVKVSTKKMAPPTTSDSYTYNSINIWVEKKFAFSTYRSLIKKNNAQILEWNELPIGVDYLDFLFLQIR